MNKAYTAQEYLRLLKAGSVGPTYENIATSLMNSRMPDVQLRMRSLSSSSPTMLGIGYGNSWADLPTPISKKVSGGGLAVMYGARPMVYVPGLENVSSDPLHSASFGSAADASWNNLSGIVSSTARSTSSSKLAIRLRPAISRWGAIHLQDLNAARGQVNVGNIPVIARRRKLFFNDAGYRARVLEEKSRAFVNAVLGGKGNSLEAFSDFRKHFIEEHASAIRLASAGKDVHINFRGIKDSSFQKIKRFKEGEGWIQDTELLVNTGSPHQHQPFGDMADVLSGDQHTNQYVAFDLVSMKKARTKGDLRYFSPGQQHPLVAGSSYGDDLVEMARVIGKKQGTFGTTIRADVGYIVGEGAELFSSHALGDSGMLSLSDRMVHATGLTSRPYEVKIVGVKGMHGLPNPTTELHEGLLNLHGVKEFLASPDQKILKFKRPKSLGLLNGKEGLAYLTGGNKTKAIKGFDFRDRVTQIVKTSTGIRLSMSRARPGAYAGRQVTLNGVRGSLGFGQGLKGLKNLDVLAYDMKSGDAVAVRQRWAAHYADKVFGIHGLDRDKRELALKTFAEMSGFNTGIHYGAGKKGSIYLHTEGIKANSPFLNGEFTTDAFRNKLSSRLSEVLGVKVSSKSLAPRIKKLSKENMSRIFMSYGMDRSEADKAVATLVKKAGGKLDLSIAIFGGQNIKFRTSDVGGLKGRGSIDDARNIFGKLIDYRGSHSDVASKVASAVQGRIADVENYVKYSQAAQASTVLGADAVEGVAKSSGGKIKIKKFSDIANEGLLSEINKSLDSTGSLTPDLYSKLMNQFGLDKSDYGLFVDFRGSRFSGLTTFTGARNLNAPDAVAASSDFAFLHNLGRVAPEFNRKSMTGFAGDVARIPRKEVVEALDAHENKALGVLSNTFNSYLEVMNPYASKGAMERRLWLSAAAGREWMLGSGGIGSKASIKGVKAGRYSAFNLATLDNDFAVGLTKGAIARKFGGNEGSLGAQMISDLEKGKDVYTFFKRDPVQSAQQLSAVKLVLLGKDKATAKGRRIFDETAFVSRMLAGASQGDFDGDNIALFLMKANSFSYQDQQNLIGDMYKQNTIAAKFFGDMLDNQALNATAGAGKVTRDNLAKVMAGKKWETLVDPAKTPTEILESIGIPKASITSAHIEALGMFQRQATSHAGVGVMHTYATRMQDVYTSLSSPKLNRFNIPYETLQAKAKELGIDHLTHSQNADWIRPIYGFLQKKTTSTESTLNFIETLKAASSGIEESSAEYRALSEKLAEQIKHVSEGVSGSKNAFYNFARESSVEYAKKAALSGKIDLKEESGFYKTLAEEMIKVKRMESWASQLGRSPNTAMTRGRTVKNISGSLLEDVLGKKVFMPATNSAGAELNSMMSEFVEAISESNINRVASSAPHGLEAAVSRTGSMIDSLAAKTAGWGGLKTAAIAAGSIAVIGMLGRSKRPDSPPPAEVPASEAPLPPQPMVGMPSDGARPSALAPSMNVARINRVPGQRRHFGGKDEIFMPPQFDVMGGYHHESLAGEDLGVLPTIENLNPFNE